MQILGIETSCDETGIAIYDTERGLLAESLHSQIAQHAIYGGVVPELASRDHIRHILPLIKQTIAKAGSSLDKLDAIAYTQGPGLAGALLVGAAVAQTLAMSLGIHAIGIHHLEGHLLSPLLSEHAPEFPFVALLVSGGHTQFMHVKDIGQYELLGETLDDAAGEAFDKTAKLLGLSYPGGPAIAQLAQQGNPDRFLFPRPMMHSGDLNMSFSGLKTSVITLVNKLIKAQHEAIAHQENHVDLLIQASTLDGQTKADICLAFETAIADLLSEKAMAALKQTQCRSLVIAGGVGANLRLRQQIEKKAKKYQATAYYPPLNLCTDNGAMIALTGALRAKRDLFKKRSDYGFSVYPRWPLDSI